MEAWVKTICKNWPDMEVKVMQDCLPKLPMSEQVTMARRLEERKQEIACGLLRVDTRLGEILKQIDPLLRYYWDKTEEMWAIQRANPFEKCWQLICLWPPERIEEIPAAFHEGNMQRFNSPQEYVAYKRAKAAKVRDENERKSTEHLLAVIDSMSESSIRQVLEVERAMITGEKIRAYGDDAKFLNAAYEATRAADRMAQDGKQSISIRAGDTEGRNGS